MSRVGVSPKFPQTPPKTASGGTTQSGVSAWGGIGSSSAAGPPPANIPCPHHPPQPPQNPNSPGQSWRSSGGGLEKKGGSGDLSTPMRPPPGL